MIVSKNSNEAETCNHWIRGSFTTLAMFSLYPIFFFLQKKQAPPDYFAFISFFRHQRNMLCYGKTRETLR